MSEIFQAFDAMLLNETGLNRQAVFDLDALPEDIIEAIRTSCAIDSYRQLILIANGGRRLWQSLQASGITSQDPIDELTKQTVAQWFAQYLTPNRYEILYPGVAFINLQKLGELAGWHHPTPFKVGIDQEWGSWYAYRAVVLTDTRFAPSKPLATVSPCAGCAHRRCITHCPAGALDSGDLDMVACISYRKQPASLCKATCLARGSCPVGEAHRYSAEQIDYTYSLSMKAIELYCR